jgi:hypothetical protein
VHSGGTIAIDGWLFAFQWWRRFGESRILHATAHDVLMSALGLGEYFRACGVLPASKEAITGSFEAGHEFAPPTIMAQAARLHYRADLFNLAITNIPGPRAPLYLLGRRMLEVLPTAPATPWHGVNVGVVSYVDELVFALTADRERIADLERLADDLRASYSETCDAALKPPQRRTRRTAARSEAVRNAYADTAPDADAAPTNEVMP